MKTSLAVLAVGLLGMLFGSLSAQQPDDEHFGMQQSSVIYEGNADVLVEGKMSCGLSHAAMFACTTAGSSSKAIESSPASGFGKSF